MQQKSSWKRLDLFILYLYVVFLLSSICSFRGITSITLGMIVLTGLIKNKQDTGNWLGRKKMNLFFLGCILFYLIQAMGLFYTDDRGQSLKHLQVKSALIVIPFALLFNTYLTDGFRQKVMKFYCFIMTGVITYCLVNALIKYRATGDVNLYFYHSLVAPVLEHAIQFSIFIFIGFVFQLESVRKGNYVVTKAVHFFMMIYFALFLALLSSKLVIAFTLLYILFYFIRAAIENKSFRLPILAALFLCLVSVSVVLVSKNPIGKRFNEIITGDIGMIAEKNFNPGDYFNGLQFRLLEWRFVAEILDENKAWVMGVSAGEAQKALDKKYISANMYIGEPARGDHGFLGYNTHNQFLESILQSGILGLAAFCIICLSLTIMVIKRKNTELPSVVLLLFAYTLNESIFETQYGLILFTFFPLFIYRSTAPETMD